MQQWKQSIRMGCNIAMDRNLCQSMSIHVSSCSCACCGNLRLFVVACVAFLASLLFGVASRRLSSLREFRVDARSSVEFFANQRCVSGVVQPVSGALCSFWTSLQPTNLGKKQHRAAQSACWMANFSEYHFQTIYDNSIISMIIDMIIHWSDLTSNFQSS